jgi:hypothetical protein
LAAVPTIPAKALGAVGSLSRCRSRTAVAPAATISTAIALVEVGAAVASRFDRTFDWW